MQFKADDVLRIPHDGGTDYVPYRNIMGIRENDFNEEDNLGLRYVIERIDGRVVEVTAPYHAVEIYKQLHPEEIA